MIGIRGPLRGGGANTTRIGGGGGGGCRKSACTACQGCGSCLGCGDRCGAKSQLEKLRGFAAQDPGGTKLGIQDAFRQDPSLAGFDILRKIAEMLGVQLPN